MSGSAVGEWTLARPRVGSSRWRRPKNAGRTRRPRQSSRGSSSSATTRCTPAARRAVEKQRDAGKLLARERAERLCDPGSFVELDRYVRHRESNFGMLERRPYGDAVVTGYGTIFGRKVFVFSQDFTVFGGSLSEVFAEKICKVMDLAAEVRLPGDRDQRLRRRADPGRRRLARRLRGDLLAQRAVLGRDPADLARHGPVRRRRRVLARDDGLRLHGRGLVVHVHHRPRRREDRHRRGGHLRGARRRRNARVEVRRRALRRARRGGVPRRRALPPLVPPAEQPRAAAVRRAVRSARPREPGARHVHPRQPEQAVRHEAGDRGGRRRRRVPRGARALRGEHRLRLRAPRRARRRRRRQPAARARRRARHRLVDEGRPLRAHVRRVQHPARHVRRRARLPARERRRSGAGSSATARSSSTRTPRRRCRSSP